MRGRRDEREMEVEWDRRIGRVKECGREGDGEQEGEEEEGKGEERERGRVHVSLSKGSSN